jgi:hypothetical protein
MAIRRQAGVGQIRSASTTNGSYLAMLKKSGWSIIVEGAVTALSFLR